MRTPEYPTRQAAPRGLIAALALAVALVAGCALLFSMLRATFDPDARAAAEAARWRAATIDEQLQPLDTAVAAGWRLLPLALVAGAGAVALLIAYRRWAVPAMIEADKIIELTRAATQRYPSGLQTLHLHHELEVEAPPASALAPLDERPALVASVPTFGTLLARGELGAGRPLVLGYTTAGEALRGSWLDLYSCAVGGLPGSGKTTSQRFFAGQAALAGARFVVVDKHAEAAEDSLAATLAPLQSLYLCEAASTEAKILEAVRLVADIGERRIAGRDTSREPILLWVDEATALLAHSAIGPALAALLEQIAQQFRKRWIYASISGQIWTASRTGGDSGLRDSLASVLAHRMKRGQARLLVPVDEALLVERLAPGQALLWRTSGQSELVSIPDTRAADIHEVARRLQTGSRPAPDRLHAGSTSVPIGARMEPDWSQNGAGSSASERGEAVSPEAARVLRLFADGADVAAIVRELYGVSSASGSAYQKRSAEVQALLRQALARQ